MPACHGLVLVSTAMVAEAAAAAAAGGGETHIMIAAMTATTDVTSMTIGTGEL